MGNYGRIAVLAARMGRAGALHPSDAWKQAAEKVIPESPSGREKGCPRESFLALCEQGWVQGLPVGAYTESVENKRYVIQAVETLRKTPFLASVSASELWRVVQGGDKHHNGQMDVVLALWNEGLLRR